MLRLDAVCVESGTTGRDSGQVNRLSGVGSHGEGGGQC